MSLSLTHTDASPAYAPTDRSTFDPASPPRGFVADEVGLCDFDVLVLLADDPPREPLMRVYGTRGEMLVVRAGNLDAALASAGWSTLPRAA